MGCFKLTFHDFVDDFDSLRSHVDNCDFENLVNPIDGVEYPNISLDIPKDIRLEILGKLSGFFGREIIDPKMFMRLSLLGDKPPHAAHNDISMGAFTFMMYLNRDEDCKGGTSFVKHKDFNMSKGVDTEEHQQAWERDANKRQMWEQTDTVLMESNKALVFNSNLMHWAETPYAFGESVQDGRLMLICFFDL